MRSFLHPGGRGDYYASDYAVAGDPLVKYMTLRLDPGPQREIESKVLKALSELHGVGIEDIHVYHTIRLLEGR